MLVVRSRNHGAVEPEVGPLLEDLAILVDGPTLTVRLGLFYGAIFIGTGASSPYLPVWFAHHGLSGSRIGLILSLPMLARAFTAPLLETPLSTLRGPPK